MRLWRISEFASLSGEGGLLFDARWHTVGRPIVYLAASAAGAMLETFIHLELDDEELPVNYQLLEISAPDALTVEELIPPAQPPDAWKLHLSITQSIGNEWLRSARTALARAPSAILPSTWNYLLNPAHPDAPQITIERAMSAQFDERLFRKMRG